MESSSVSGSSWRPGCYWTCWTRWTKSEYKHYQNTQQKVKKRFSLWIQKQMKYVSLELNIKCFSPSVYVGTTWTRWPCWKGRCKRSARTHWTPRTSWSQWRDRSLCEYPSELSPPVSPIVFCLHVYLQPCTEHKNTRVTCTRREEFKTPSEVENLHVESPWKQQESDCAKVTPHYNVMSCMTQSGYEFNSVDGLHDQYTQ